jgi:hypothetical protein
MKKKFPWLIGMAPLILAIGCSTSHQQVEPWSGESWSLDTWTKERPYEKLEQDLAGKDVLIEMGNGFSFKGTDFRMDVTTATWWDLTTQQKNSAPTDQIWRLQTRSPGKGAAKGFGAGLLIGGSVGAVIGATGSDPSMEAPLGAIVLGAIGGILGLVAGGAAGSTTIYVINPELAPPLTPEPGPGLEDH